MTTMVDLKGNKDVTVKNLEDILYVAHSDDSKCAFAKFEIYNSTYGEKADPAARTTKLEVGMPDLVVVVTAEDGTTAVNWFQCQGQFFDSNRYKITTVTGEKSVSTAWPPY